jgi:NADH-quinone oxidoreductase subunit L
MFRLYFLTFHGKFRGTHEQEHHLHESPKSMTVPLIILAVLAVGGGFLGIPDGHNHWLHFFLKPSYAFGHSGTWIFDPHHFNAEEAKLMGFAVAGALAAIYFAYMMYRKNNVLPDESEETMGKTQRVIFNKYYVDEIYDAVIRKPLDVISDFAYRFMEIRFVDAIVNGIGNGARWAGEGIRQLQTGSLGFYVFMMSIAAIVILFIQMF